VGYARGKLIEETKTLPRDRRDWYDLSIRPGTDLQRLVVKLGWDKRGGNDTYLGLA
jgi:hypothetical protein